MCFYLEKMYFHRQKINEKTIYFKYFLNEQKYKVGYWKDNMWNQQDTYTFQQQMGHHPTPLIFSYLNYPIKLYYSVPVIWLITHTCVYVMSVSVKVIMCHQKLKNRILFKILTTIYINMHIVQKLNKHKRELVSGVSLSWDPDELCLQGGEINSQHLMQINIKEKKRINNSLD